METEETYPEHISVSMPPQMQKRLKQVAKEKGYQKLSPLIRMMIAEYLERQDFLANINPNHIEDVIRKLPDKEFMRKFLNEIWRRGFYDKGVDGNE